MFLPSDPVFLAIFWSVATLGAYAAARRLARLRPAWWSSPLITTPAVLIALALLLHTDYRGYIGGTHWLMLMLGPVTVAFAVPIWQHRALIRRHWPVLLVGVVMGSGMAMLSAWGLARLLGVSDVLQRSLMPRSVTTPFAMSISGNIGGVPDLTAVFVVITGVSGAALGDLVLRVLPLRSSLARGALFGMGAHGAGVAQATRIGGEEGSIAGLVMVAAGLLNVAVAPLLELLLN